MHFVFILLTLEVATIRSYFCTMICVYKLYGLLSTCHYATTCEHSYSQLAASFSLKTRKLMTFFIVRTDSSQIKPMRDPESTLKIKVKVSKGSLANYTCSSNYLKTKFSLLKRYCNIFKTANATKLTNTILQSTCKVL